MMKRFVQGLLFCGSLIHLSFIPMMPDQSPARLVGPWWWWIQVVVPLQLYTPKIRRNNGKPDHQYHVCRCFVAVEDIIHVFRAQKNHKFFIFFTPLLLGIQRIAAYARLKLDYSWSYPRHTRPKPILQQNGLSKNPSTNDQIKTISRILKITQRKNCRANFSTQREKNFNIEYPKEPPRPY